jgi:hypothetical protein
MADEQSTNFVSRDLLERPRRKMDDPDRYKRVYVCKGIRRDRVAWAVSAYFGGRQIDKRFPLTTSIETLRRWQEETRLRLAANRLAEPPRHIAEAFPVPSRRSEHGWCYVYFLQDEDAIKIGKANHVGRRIDELQIGSKRPLKLIAAVPAHAHLERALHHLFRRDALGREWFSVSKRLIQYIQRLRSGENPVALLWEFQNYADLCRQGWIADERRRKWLPAHRRSVLSADRNLLATLT